jgi:ArsR family transcriptional regulator, arsenate/arsenite/antimonite-responsive transcriptional repressor
MIKEKPYTIEQERMARYAKALSHPARLFILEYLSRCEGCIVGSIVDELPMAQSTVSQHLRELRESGLIRGNIEPPKIKYCIDRENYEEARRLFKDFF